VNPVWRVLARVRGAAAADAVFSLLDDATGTVSGSETSPDEWRLEAYPRSAALTPFLVARFSLLAAGAGGELIEIAEERLAPRDWLAENQLTFPPQRVGRFFIYGSHYRGGVPAGCIGIAVDAATAFGTGEHPSTRGCLVALENLSRSRRIRRPVDIGTGSGILSIAAAKLLRRPVLATDVDPGAVDVARHNIAHNGVGRIVRVREAPGYRDRTMRMTRYDLILSNILARPLALMAADLALVLAPGGRAVLSGLLRRQEPIVIAPHRSLGIVLERRVAIDGWSTLVMRRPETEMGAKAPISELASVERALRPLYAGRTSLGSGRRQATRMATTGEHPLPNRRFANGEFRCRRASDRRATSTRHKHAPDAAIRKKLGRLK